MGGKISSSSPGVSQSAKKFEVSLDIESYLDGTDPEQKARRQARRVRVLADSILEWVLEEGDRSDVIGAREDLETALAKLMPKALGGTPLEREEMEELNDIYDKYNSD